jgi:hypothetical protein
MWSSMTCHVVDFAVAAVMHAFRLADAAEVEARRRVAEADEGARQRLRHLIFHRAAVQRMRVRDQGDAARRAFRRPACIPSCRRAVR